MMMISNSEVLHFLNQILNQKIVKHCLVYNVVFLIHLQCLCESVVEVMKDEPRCYLFASSMSNVNL